jgi:hypothetical protein
VATVGVVDAQEAAAEQPAVGGPDRLEDDQGAETGGEPRPDPSAEPPGVPSRSPVRRNRSGAIGPARRRRGIPPASRGCASVRAAGATGCGRSARSAGPWPGGPVRCEAPTPGRCGRSWSSVRATRW